MNGEALEARLKEITRQLEDLSEGVAAALRSETIEMYANVRIELLGPDGRRKKLLDIHNLVTTACKQKLLLLSAAFYLNQFAYMAIGTGVTAASAADTALQTEVARTAIITPTNPDANTLQFVGSYAAGVGTGAITEVGLLSAAAVGTLANHQVFSVINKGASDTLTITVQFTIS